MAVEESASRESTTLLSVVLQKGHLIEFRISKSGGTGIFPEVNRKGALTSGAYQLFRPFPTLFQVPPQSMASERNLRDFGWADTDGFEFIN